MILLVLWLLLHAPSTTFFSERPHLVSLAVDREVASRVDSYVLDLLPPEDHANSTRSGYDVSGFLDPVKVIHTIGRTRKLHLSTLIKLRSCQHHLQIIKPYPGQLGVLCIQ